MDLTIRIKETVDFIMCTEILQVPTSNLLIILQMISHRIHKCYSVV